MEDMKTIGAPEMNVIGAPIRSSKNIVITPDVKYESYAAESGDTSIDDILPAEGAKDTIYRVASWDGTQVDATKSSEYVWDGENYILLRVLEDSIGDGVFDISAYNASGGTLATYADLAAALGTSGANVPEGVRKGGMSVKYVQSSDNKYVQFRYMPSDAATVANFTNVANWQGVDETPTSGSDNLVKSGGVLSDISNLSEATIGKILDMEYYQGNINGTSGKYQSIGTRVTTTIPLTTNFSYKCKTGFMVNAIARYKDGYSPVNGGTVNTDFIEESISGGAMINKDVEINNSFPNTYITIRKTSSTDTVTLDEARDNVELFFPNSLKDITVKKVDIVDNLTTNDATKVLSAKQGKLLKDEVDAVDNELTKAVKVDAAQEFTLAEKEQALKNIGLYDYSNVRVFSLAATTGSKQITNTYFDFGKKVAIRLLCNDAVITGNVRATPYGTLDTSSIGYSYLLKDEWAIFDAGDDKVGRLYIIVDGTVTVSGKISVVCVYDEGFVDELVKSQVLYGMVPKNNTGLEIGRVHPYSSHYVFRNVKTCVTKGLVKSPFSITTRNDYYVYEVEKYSYGSSGLEFLGYTTISNSSYSVEEDAYYYRIIFKRTDDADMSSYDYNQIVDTFRSSYDLIENTVLNPTKIAVGESISETIPHNETHNASKSVLLDSPLRFADYTDITAIITSEQQTEDELVVYALYSDSVSSRIRIISIKTTIRNEFVIPSNGNNYFYGFFFYNSKDVDFNISIQIKTSGTAYKLKSDDYAERCANVLPDYYFENGYIEHKKEVLGNLVRKCALSGDSFYFVTDTHWEYNQRHSPAIIKELNKVLNLQMVVHGGDIYHNGPVIVPFRNECIDAFKHSIDNGNVLVADGNHEYTEYDNGCTYGASFVNNRAHISKAVYGSSDKVYYYIDNPVTKTRYVFIYIYGERSGGSYVNGLTDQNQLNWIENVALDVENGWDIIFFGHTIVVTHAPTLDIGAVSGADNVFNIIDNYSGNGNIVAFICGHSHADGVSMSSCKCPCIISTCDHNYPFNVGDYVDLSDLTEPRVSGTITEQAVDVVIYDKENSIIHFGRIGSRAMNRSVSHNSNLVQVDYRSVFTQAISVNDSVVLDTLLSGTITWASADTSVVSVNDGTITGVSAGDTVITATSNNGERQSYFVKVE